MVYGGLSIAMFDDWKVYAMYNDRLDETCVIILVSSQTHAASKPNENSSAIKK
jgi:hypothetical protein